MSWTVIDEFGFGLAVEQRHLRIRLVELIQYAATCRGHTRDRLGWTHCRRDDRSTRHAQYSG